jgi:hypothetical protein
MRPTLRPGDVLELSGCQPDRLRVGRIVVFDAPGVPLPVVHRIWHVDGLGLITRGDSLNLPDPWRVPPEAVLGCVTAVHRPSGRSVPFDGRSSLWLVAFRRSCGKRKKRIAQALTPVLQSDTVGLLARRLAPRSLLPRVVRFRTDGESKWRLISGHHSIGIYHTDTSRWAIRRCWLPLVDPRLLHRPEADD